MTTTNDSRTGEKRLRVSDLELPELNRLKQKLNPKLTKYIPHDPFPKQQAFLLLTHKEAFYGGAAGGGKDLATTTPIITDKGWKTVGTLTKDDRVAALDGSWSEIEYITPERVPEKSYRITFSDGSQIDCSDTHLWLVDRKEQINRNHRHWINVERRVMTTEQMIEDGVRYKAHGRKNKQKRFMLPQHRGYKGVERDFDDVSPYLLGLWLGDGRSIRGEIATGDEDVLHVVEKLYERDRDIEIIDTNSNCKIIRIKGLTEQLRELGVLNNKHIPLEHKLASRDQRLRLLQGLMDSDGYIQQRGRAEWGQKAERQQLFDDVCELVASLGYKYSTTVAPSTYDGQEFPSNRITFTPREVVATIPRKRARIKDDGKQDYNSAIYIEKIEEVDSVPMKCIRIKHESHTFLVGKSQIPTHNSDALLMAALQFVDVPGYAAILFRKTYKELALPEALIFRAKEWLTPYMNSGEVRWSEQDKMFTFPSGATLSFGYLETDTDMSRYQSAEFQFIGFDELTHFKEKHYRYLFSRLRRLKGVDIPLRMRAASNPGSQGHEWVKQRFLIDGPSEGRIFIPATLDDNIHIDREEYMKSLQELDPITREQLEKGDWDIEPEGNMFKRQWFEIVEAAPSRAARVRYWDLAATQEAPGKDPDWTVGVKMAAKDGIYYIEDVRRVREDPAGVEQLVKHTAQLDGRSVPIFMEEEPGSSGKNNTYHYQRYVLSGFTFEGDRVTGSKVIRANPLSSAAKAGNVKIVRGAWNSDFLDEIALFPLGNYKDQVDATSGALSKINEKNVVQSDPEAMEALRGARVYSRTM